MHTFSRNNFALQNFSQYMNTVKKGELKTIVARFTVKYEKPKEPECIISSLKESPVNFPRNTKRLICSDKERD